MATMGMTASTVTIPTTDGPSALDPDMEQALAGLLSSCALCPRACGADRLSGKRGICGADGRLRVARAALHHWEEPCISGEVGSGTVFFSYCPMHCVYCQNRSIAAGDAGSQISVSRLAQIFLELQEQGAWNVNLVTPTHYAPHIVSAIHIARALGLGIPIVYNTSGYESCDALSILEGVVDVYLSDFKYSDASTAARYSNAPDYPQVALGAIRAMVEQTGEPSFESAEEGFPARLARGVVVRHLMLPGRLEESKRAVKTLHDHFGSDILLSLMSQYTPLPGLDSYPELQSRVSSEEYEELLDYADGLGIEDYYWQDGEADSESFIPAFDGTGVHSAAKP